MVHDIEEDHKGAGGTVILHDSGGFEAGDEINYSDVQAFIDRRRVQYPFQNQLHCVWYIKTSPFAAYLVKDLD